MIVVLTRRPHIFLLLWNDCLLMSKVYEHGLSTFGAEYVDRFRSPRIIPPCCPFLFLGFSVHPLSVVICIYLSYTCRSTIIRAALRPLFVFSFVVWDL